MSKYARREQKKGWQLFRLLPVSAFPGIASAHTLSAEEGLHSQLNHQLLGLHHFPMTAILILAAIVVVWKYLQNCARPNNRPLR